MKRRMLDREGNTHSRALQSKSPENPEPARDHVGGDFRYCSTEFFDASSHLLPVSPPFPTIHGH
jgi:hypothetical protein